MAEKVTRGQFMRFFQTAIRRGPAGLRKEWLYGNLKPLVDSLEADLKEAGVLPKEADQNAPQEPEQEPVEQLQPAPDQDQAQGEAEPEETELPAPDQEAEEETEKEDLGGNPKKPARKGKK